MFTKSLNIYLLSFAFFLSLMPNLAKAQDTKERPKVGLVLSGGGAKGFAHVGVLKELEKYNIPIDYIGGTSIGAIIGALYSVGYTSDEIEKMILAQDWETLFVDKPSRTYLPFFEKDEQKRYLLTMEFKDGGLNIPNYAVTNNGVMKLFSDLTLGYHDVDDFNDLPIPFLCIAVDLQTGDEIVLNSGSLAEAIVSSMAIPGVFPSVKTDSTILIDGGMRNNFPVDHVRAMGADIIIGVDVGVTNKPREELESFVGMLDQLTLMLGTDKYDVNRADCDLYIKPDISNFSTADFTHEAAIDLITEGVRVGESHSDEFGKIANLFTGDSISKNVGYQPLMSPDSTMISNFVISGSRLSDADILGVMGVDKETNACSLDEMQLGLERLHSSLKFSSISYSLNVDSVTDEYTLNLQMEDYSQNAISFGAHYNSQENVALLFNATLNSPFLSNSRISADVKLSESPALDLRYNINRGSLPGLGLMYGYRARSMEVYDDGVQTGEGNIKKNYLEINTNSVINKHFTVGLGARYERFNLNKTIGDFPLEVGKYDYIMYRFFFKLDTEDEDYYPTSGRKYYSTTDLVTDNGYELDGGVPIVVAYLSMEQVFSIDSRWTVTPQISTQLQFFKDTHVPAFYNTYVGGVYEPLDIVSHIPFWGLQWGEYQACNIFVAGIENRYHLGGKHYAYANVNAFVSSERLTQISGDDLDYRIGGALGYSYDSLVGPLDIFFSMSNGTNVLTYLNVGYTF